MQNLFAVILAGGSGTRLWPRSRATRPKQFLDLVSDQTMVQQTVNRLLPLIPVEHIYFVAGAPHAGEMRKQVPDVPEENLIIEPTARGTGPCVALAAAYLRRRDPDATMVSLHADHFILHEDRFRDALRASHAMAQQKMLVTLGATPTYAETGYGYIERGEALPDIDQQKVFRIARFTEKPDPETAERMTASGRYYWNTGMFTWRVDTILEAFAQWMPEFNRQLQSIARALGTAHESETLNRIWPQVKVETIDRGIMEHATNAAVIPVDIGWSDIGSWAALDDLLEADEQGNVVRGDHLIIDTHDSFIHSNGKLIAIIGLRELIVVETEDTILICPKHRAQEVKDIVEQLKQQKREHLI